ncbi:MAG: nickel/cobalt efflux transporter RcnA [Caulobacter sp.]|nr:nickel/cobalt efflux transporter RcnA [Caulobacter sp.]
MVSLPELLQQSAAHAWLFMPTAILLGALHGLEPGHSKTMMAAFIIAVRGTWRQAVLLGLCATLSHTLIVWVIALGGMYLWRGLAPETVEPYLQVASATIIVGMGLWMLWRARRDRLAALAHDADRHHGHDHHHHHDESRAIDTGHGVVRLSVFEDGVPPRFRLDFGAGHGWAAADVSVETQRPDGSRQAFAFAARDGFLESIDEIPEPHDFVARLNLGHGDHVHAYDVVFSETGHVHDPLLEGLDQAGGYQDAHELAHANDIRRRFAGREATTGQIVLFGLTGGLVPCPGAITVLLLCLQLQKLALGSTLVLCFSIGLALTMVASGVLAALSVRHVSKRFSGFGDLVRKAPYISGAVILLIGLYLGISGWTHLPGR